MTSIDTTGVTAGGEGNEPSGRVREGVPGRGFCEDLGSMSMERFLLACSGVPFVRPRSLRGSGLVPDSPYST